MATDRAFNLSIRGRSLCMWEVTYWLPDTPLILAPAFLRQEYDLPPSFPELRKFLDFWTRNLDGKLHSVTVVSNALVQPARFRMVGTELRMH